MGNKHSIASRKRWAGVSQEERSKRGRLMALAKWSKMSIEDRKKQIEKMNKARASG